MLVLVDEGPVHVPEPPLAICGLGRLGAKPSVRIAVDHREVTKDQRQLPLGQPPAQHRADRGILVRAGQ
jgi:hypothetical protein